ncbi:MAG: hybrid sensor histidine kinase/response regulator transcription factor, partial [Bacteroidota bacterium]
FHDNGFLYWNEYQIDLSNNSVKRLVDVDAYRQILVRLDQRQQKIWLGVNGSAYDLFVYDLSRDSTAQIILPDSISASSKLFSYISNLVIHPKLDTVYVTFDDQILKFDKAAQLLAMQKASKQNFLWKLSHVDLSNWEVEDRSLDLSAYQNDPFYRQLPRTFNLLQGNGQQLWAITEKGVFELNAPTQNMTSFPMFPIFSEILFQDLPAFSSPSGKIYHGLNNGTVIAFAPQDLKKAAVLKQSFPIALSRYQWYDAKRDRIFQQKTELYKLKKIELKHYERYFELSFFVPDYRKPDQNKYRWWLEGYEKNWSIPSSSNQLRYENLPAGNYTLHLQGGLTEDYFKSSEKIIRIKVLRAWYKQWWAWMIYIILVGSLIGWMYRFQLLRRLEKAEVKRVAELDLIKSRFYTNITHEFRTPLTVILGMAQEEKDFSKARTLITRNGKKLLQLINQLLDLSKLDSKHLQANYQQIEIVSFTQYIGESFQSLAEKKHIRLTIYSEINELWMDMDEEKYQQIIGNLLSNAIKFTPESGKITLHLTHKAQTFQIGIKDNGVGIATAELPHIFDRFYQVDNTASQQGKGTGIGLALVKELVELMEGAIEVESCPKEGTTFRIHFPIRTNANEQLTTFQKWTIDQSIVEQAAQAVTMPTEDAPSLLIVEDNSDVVHYIQSVLQSSYRLSIASNGEDGIQKAIEIVPDIIISDVMMPKKNGFEVVETLKQDERTSHIPIILLTAKATQADKIEGLKYGADAYLMKPFDKTELLIRLKNLIEVRRQLQARYAGFKVSDTSEAENLFASNGTLEDQFLQKVQDLLKTNYQNTQFGVEDYAQALQMSHTQFYRKLKALTNQTPSQHVRGYRLAQAKILLKNPNFNVSEVAYEVGFNDPNYFTRVFTKAFGRSPNAYRNSSSTNEN